MQVVSSVPLTGAAQLPGPAHTSAMSNVKDVITNWSTHHMRHNVKIRPVHKTVTTVTDKESDRESKSDSAREREGLDWISIDIHDNCTY